MLQDTRLVALRRLNATFIHNFVTNDVVSHSAIIHPRFLCIMPDGSRMYRADYLAFWATAFDPEVITYWDYRDERIEIFDTAALVSATTCYTRRSGDIDKSGMTFYTDTYLLEDDRWLCIQAQLTALQPEHFPPDDTVIRRYHHGKLKEQV
jgi:hypothetical protein